MATHYHIWHHPALELSPGFASTTIMTPTIRKPRITEPMQVQSLRNDLDKLRADGAAKGIADAGKREIGMSGSFRHPREIWALKLGKGTEHKVLIAGCIHAREWLSVEIPFLTAKYLIDNYSETPSEEEGEGLAPLEVRKRIKHLLDNREIWFVPMINPDGHMRTMTKNRLWRSNCRTYHLPAGVVKATNHKTREVVERPYPEGRYRGVDLNRNFPTRSWGEETFDKKGRVHTSRLPEDGAHDIWTGPWAGSEPETQVMVKLINEHRFKASISFHSFGKFLMYSEFGEGAPYLLKIGEGMWQVMTIPGTDTQDYQYMCGDTALYPITGHLADYCLERAPGQPALTCELPPKDPLPDDNLGYNGLPEQAIEPAFREALPGILALINSAGFSAPAGSHKLCADGSTRVVQVVRNCWEVFRKWPVPTAAEPKI
jgi:carboxypeptidase T